MENQPIGRACFVCGSAAGVRMFDQAIEVCGLGPVRYGLRCCDGCGLVLQDPAVSPQTMARQYAMFSNYLAFGDGDPPLSSTAARMLDCVARADLKPGRVYDVGAAAGFMLWHLRAQGWKVGGCDPSPAAVAQAKARFGVELDTGTGEITLKDHAGLDLVTMSHVLEHIYDPAAALGVVRAALAEGGHLLIEVPCLTAPEINPPGLFMMEHLNYFEAGSLKNLLSGAGFEIVDSEVTLDFFPFPVITVLARKASATGGAGLVNGFADNLRFLETYAGVDAERWRSVDARLRSALAEGEEVYVWGAGIHTSTLLTRTSLETWANILAITDRDSQKHGHRLGHHPVVEPDAALQSGRKIVISSYVSEKAIAASLGGQGVAPDRNVRLYT
ncbi:class I SAM-dependent methyltransferase [Phenylobacterium montanum]|uniref:Class I SAM-dependent methyltransferase n=1 Tax=Phenylobacterium montanum TaxID=2823693 RepID=A0A975G2X4_9CAUL|nr:class I SAM-dependent methyltransferase [Caulobacter sp. S6]QUD89721.1 class I SAM-dependent methyltransferase [Caulobacter sp. S6]